MAELDSRNAPGGQVGDTFNDEEITRVFSDGVYLWSPIPTEELIEDIVEEELAENDQTTDHYAIVRNILNF